RNVLLDRPCCDSRCPLRFLHLKAVPLQQFPQALRGEEVQMSGWAYKRFIFTQHSRKDASEVWQRDSHYASRDQQACRLRNPKVHIWCMQQNLTHQNGAKRVGFGHEVLERDRQGHSSDQLCCYPPFRRRELESRYLKSRFSGFSGTESESAPY